MAILSEPASRPGEDALPRATRLSTLWRFCRENPLGAAGAVVVFLMFFMAVFADFVTVYDPTRNNFGAMLEPLPG